MTINQLILPSDTKTVVVEDIPSLIAEARHPTPVEIYGNFDWVHDASERKSLQLATETAHKELLYKAIRNGTLVARNSTTGISDPLAEGGAALDCPCRC
jgi:hypothetical protein